MVRLAKFSIALAVFALVVAPAAAQQPQRQRGQRPGGGGMGGGLMPATMLVGQKAVQEDLKMDADQVQKFTDFSAKQREAFAGLRDLSQEERTAKMQENAKAGEKLVSEVLKPEQQKRVKQLQLQAAGGNALAQKEIQDQLKLNDEQKEKVKAIQEDGRKAMGELLQGGGGGDRQEAAKKMAEMRKSNTEKLMKVLNADQTAMWKEMTGEPFKGEFNFGFGGGRRPGGNR